MPLLRLHRFLFARLKSVSDSTFAPQGSWRTSRRARGRPAPRPPPSPPPRACPPRTPRSLASPRSGRAKINTTVAVRTTTVARSATTTGRIPPALRPTTTTTAGTTTTTPPSRSAARGMGGSKSKARIPVQLLHTRDRHGAVRPQRSGQRRDATFPSGTPHGPCAATRGTASWT